MSDTPQPARPPETRRRPRRAVSPATRDGVPIEADTLLGSTQDDIPDQGGTPTGDDDGWLTWLVAQRPPHWD